MAGLILLPNAIRGAEATLAYARRAFRRHQAAEATAEGYPAYLEAQEALRAAERHYRAVTSL